MKTFMNKILSRRLLLIITLVSAICFSYMVYELQVLPLKYYIPMILIVIIMPIVLYFFEANKNNDHTMRVTIVKLINVLFAVCLVFVTLNVSKGSDFLSAITKVDDQSIEMNVLVLKNSSDATLTDLKGKKFGANTSIDAININKTEAKIEDSLGQIEVAQYSDYSQLITDLENNKINAIIIKATDLQSLEEIKEDINDVVKVIETIKLKIPSVEANSAEVTQETFNILISGADIEGDASTFSSALSDVNMVATINPKTKQILLTSIPRDYFVDIIGMKNVNGKDKLTHSAKGGISCTMKTIENLLGIKFNYYARLNFTSFMKVIDALGGITVDVPKYDVIGRDDGVFTTYIYDYTMKPGVNDFDSKQALAFVRERHAFVEGDVIRGQNQMLMMKAIIKKCCSASIITKMDGVFKSLIDCFEINMTSAEIKSLINMQIDDMASWDVQSYHLTGGGDYRAKTLATVGDVTKANKNGLYVMMPNQNSITKAKTYIDIVTEGKEILKVKEDSE